MTIMEDNTNMEVARMDGGAVVVRDPFDAKVAHSFGTIAEARDYLTRCSRERRAERREQFDALGEIAAAPLGDVKNLRWAIETDAKNLLAAEKGVTDAVLDATGMKAVIVQWRGTGAKIDPMSDRGAFAEMVAALKKREDAAKPSAPRHTYIYAVTATDAEHTALQRAMRKADEKFGVCIPQNDSEWKAAERLFKSR